MVFSGIIKKQVGPWIDWIQPGGPFQSKIVDAFKLLDADHKEYVTFEDLKARCATKAFAQHKEQLKGFYHKVAKLTLGSDAHKEFLKHELPKMPAPLLADVIAALPEEVSRMHKSMILNLTPKAVIEGITTELNKRLADVGAVTIDAEVIPGLIACMGTNLPGHSRPMAVGGRS